MDSVMHVICLFVVCTLPNHTPSMHLLAIRGLSLHHTPLFVPSMRMIFFGSGDVVKWSASYHTYITLNISQAIIHREH